MAHERALERLVDKRRLAGAGDAGDHRERADGEVRGDILKVVLATAGDGEEARFVVRGSWLVVRFRR